MEDERSPLLQAPADTGPYQATADLPIANGDDPEADPATETDKPKAFLDLCIVVEWLAWYPIR